MTPGDRKLINGVIFHCVAAGQINAYSQADRTSQDTVVEVLIIEDSGDRPLWVKPLRYGQLGWAANDWETAAETLNREYFARRDKEREQETALASGYDELTDNPAGTGKREGPVLYERQSDGTVQAKSVNDTTTQNPATLKYENGGVVIYTDPNRPSRAFETWDDVQRELESFFKPDDTAKQTRLLIEEAYDHLPDA